MKLVCWNIQWGRGCDGRVDLARIVSEARRVADFDVLCLQEVSRGFDTRPPADGDAEGGASLPGLTASDRSDGVGLPGGTGVDQFAELASLLPGYTVLDGVAVDLPPAVAGAPRRHFGNAIISRLPIRQVWRHSLPWPADPGVPSMPRIALEAVIDSGKGLVRVITTHLEYYSEQQRLAQVEALRIMHAEACAHARRPAPLEKPGTPFAATDRPSAAILCGDFNSAAGDSAYQRMVAPMPATAGAPDFFDAWLLKHPGPVAGPQRVPTTGVHDHEQWADGPFPCDFFFVTGDLAERVSRCEVDLQSDASDHQPMLLELH